MNLRSMVVSVVALTVVACGPQEPATESDGTWVGTITTEGNVTTVVNESGSVWRGTATLVEEASIGVASGEDPYMLGNVANVWATEEEIYIIDAGIPALRVYDRDGAYLRDIGRQGQGSGEYEIPFRLVVGPQGKLFLVDLGSVNTLIVYGANDAYLDTWSWPGNIRPVRPKLVVTPDGTPHLEAIERERGIPTEDESRFGMQPVGAEGKAGELREFPHLEFEYPAMTYLDGRLVTFVPFMPVLTRTMTAAGAIVSGVGSRYRFSIEHADASETIIERQGDPVPVSADERTAHETFTTSQIRARDPGWSWNGVPIPAHKPAFSEFFAGQLGQLLVKRPGPSRRGNHLDCMDDPTPDDFVRAQQESRTLSVCWSDTTIWDVFGPDGRFMGELDVPDLAGAADPFLSGRTLLLAVEDAAGTIMVKRYRLVLPGQSGSASYELGGAP